MNHFEHEGFRLAYVDEAPAEGGGEPILLIHGFSSNVHVNWVGPGWVRDLTGAGHRVIAFDHRGHGKSSASYEPADYTPSKMAGDAAALLDLLGIERAHVMGYSMGARVSTVLALEHPDKVATLILGGLGIGMVEGVGDWDPIADALRVDDATTVTHPRGKMFRNFADQTGSDRLALAACIETSRILLTEAEVARVTQPTLIAVGTKDDIAGSADELAALMPDAQAFAIEGRDHMLSVGDRTFKKKALQFLKEHPL
jgi:pimeloyl-ACP methyl ester carboxylesterase